MLSDVTIAYYCIHCLMCKSVRHNAGIIIESFHKLSNSWFGGLEMKTFSVFTWINSFYLAIDVHVCL